MLYTNGVPPPSSIVSLEMLRNASKRKRHQLQIRAETERMVYTGVNYGQQGTSSQRAGTTVVAVFHKASKTLKLVPAPQVADVRGISYRPISNPTHPLAQQSPLRHTSAAPTSTYPLSHGAARLSPPPHAGLASVSSIRCTS